MQQVEQSDNWFLFLYVLATAAGAGVGVNVLGSLAKEYTSHPPVLIIAAVLAGACIGLAQWLVLRHWIGMDGAWVVVTAIGGPAVLAIFVTPLLASLQLVVGALQWLTLRRYLPDAAWWIPVRLVAWLLAMVAGIAAGVALAAFGPSDPLPPGARGFRVSYLVAFGPAVFGAVLGLVTGVALRILIRKSRRAVNSGAPELL